MVKRPTCEGATITTPKSILSIALFGAMKTGGQFLTSDEFKSIQKLYGFVNEKPNKKPDLPVKPIREEFKTNYDYDDAKFLYERQVKAHDNWKDPQKLMQSGADRNAIRDAQSDGLRLIAWLAKYIPAGEDPLKHLIQFVSQAGCDVDPEDLDWADKDPDDVDIE